MNRLIKFSVFCTTCFMLSSVLSGAGHAAQEAKGRKPNAVLSDEAEDADSNKRRMFNFTSGTTFNMALIPRQVGEYAAGDIYAPAQVYIWADPSEPDAITFLSSHWDPFVRKYVDTGMARIAFRPITLTPKATAAAAIMSCVGPSAGVAFLQQTAKLDPIWATRRYPEAVQALVKGAIAVGLEERDVYACLNNGDISLNNVRVFAKDVRRINYWNKEGINIYVNGGWWPGLEHWALVKKQVELENKDTQDVGENNPLLTIQPEDRVFGDPNARVKLFDYGNVIRVQHRSFFREGFDSRLRSYIATGEFAYIYRPFHFGGETRRAEIAGACVPQARFFDFLDYISQNKHFWRDLEEPGEIIEPIALVYGAKKSCFKDPDVAKKIDSARDEAIEKLGVIRVSTYFYKGIRYYGDLPLDLLPEFIKNVDQKRSEGK